MDIYDRDGNFIGEILDDTKEIVSDTSSRISGWFETSFLLGVLGLMVHPILGIAIAIIMVFLRIAVFLVKWMLICIWYFVKFLVRCLWWLIRLPFTKTIYGNWPEF